MCQDTISSGWKNWPIMAARWLSFAHRSALMFLGYSAYEWVSLTLFINNTVASPLYWVMSFIGSIVWHISWKIEKLPILHGRQALPALVWNVDFYLEERLLFSLESKTIPLWIGGWSGYNICYPRTARFDSDSLTASFLPSLEGILWGI